MELDLWQNYHNRYPDLFQLVGGDIFNGTASQLRSFQTQTGATYPLLLAAGSPTGGSWSVLYGPWDNYVVVDPDGIVRYHAATKWPHGNRYHPFEIKAVIDSILIAVGVPEDAPRLPGFDLLVGPNPFQASTGIEFTNPDPEPAPYKVTVLDVSGRVAAILREGLASPGLNRLRWDGRLDRGGRARSGRYLVRVDLRGYSIARSIVLMR